MDYYKASLTEENLATLRNEILAARSVFNALRTKLKASKTTDEQLKYTRLWDMAIGQIRALERYYVDAKRVQAGRPLYCC